jgi:hypothetical protein
MFVLPKNLKQLCTPALIYFVMSMIATFVMILQNIGSKNKFCLGTFSCNVPNVSLIFVLKILYILFWTWILDLICKSGHTNISWFLLFLPFIFAFVLLGLLFIS